MASRNVNTGELRKKHRMSQPQVLEVLKKAKIKPVDKIDMGGRGTLLMWPNRAANAALRAYREEHPAKRRPGESKRAAKSNVRNFTAFRENKQITALTKQVEVLTARVTELAAMWQPTRKTG